jgi:hypothetical protein
MGTGFQAFASFSKNFGNLRKNKGKLWRKQEKTRVPERKAALSLVRFMLCVGNVLGAV